MARACSFSFGSRSGAGHWSFDGTNLLVSPDSGAPISVPTREIAGITGDGYTLTLTVPAGGAAAATAELTLAKLGADGPSLLEELRRVWLAARAEVLRLGGTGQGKPFSGRVTGIDPASSLAEPFQALLFEDVLVVARDGRDVAPLFLALSGSIEYDDPAYCVSVRQWPGQEIVFSKMAGQTNEFLTWLRTHRVTLATGASATLAAALPSLPVGGRGVLAGVWLPGRLMEVPGMDSLCPGFAAALRDTWLANCVRKDEGRYLLDWAASGAAWLGCTRAGADDAGTSADGQQPLWLLCGKNGTWFLEALSIEDRATYCFSGGDEMPVLVSQLLCAPQFCKEALYNPLDQLTGDNADLAIPAQYLGFLVALRERFKTRVIHRSPEGWRADVEELAKQAG
jgi:hypothetical protein